MPQEQTGGVMKADRRVRFPDRFQAGLTKH